MKKIVALLFLSLLLSGYTDKEFKITGYYPFNCSAKERRVEGGIHDKFRNKLKPLHSGQDYVSVAVDPRVIPLNSYLIIDTFPDVVFKAVDVGRAVKRAHIDICVKDRKTAHNLPKKAKVTIVDIKYIGLKIGEGLSFLRR